MNAKATNKNTCTPENRVCAHGLDTCSQTTSDGQFICTLKRGHRGNHVACGCTIHNITSWANKKDKR